MQLLTGAQKIVIVIPTNIVLISFARQKMTITQLVVPVTVNATEETVMSIGSKRAMEALYIVNQPSRDIVCRTYIRTRF